MVLTADFAVIGGGIVGSCIAYGLLRQGVSVALLDGAPDDPRASTANFGLVWVQGKGSDIPAYQHLTRQASDLWPDFAAELTDIATTRRDPGTLPLAYERNGGLTFTFGEEGYAKREETLNRLHNESGGLSIDHEMIDREAIRRLMPDFELGPEVSGASYCWRDGCVNPLALQSALLRAIVRLGGQVRYGWPVQDAQDWGQGWNLVSPRGRVSASHVVLAAGLGSRKLAGKLGLSVPVRPQRGQVLVSQRMPRVMPLPASTLRQTADGTFLVGATKEDVGFDQSTTVDAAGELSLNALRITPAVRHINVVRQWAGLRVMTPDGAPVYDFAGRASAAACHSGITLAPLHADNFVASALKGTSGDVLAPFSPDRFSSL